MFLRTVEIRNFLSLEHVTLEDLGELNTLIGRNNVGKSAVLDAIALLGNVVNENGLDRFDNDPITALTDCDPNRSLEYRLLFDTREEDREGLFELRISLRRCAIGEKN